MAENMLATLLPVATLILGVSLNELASWFRYRRETTRERESRRWAARDKIIERRNELQRQSLLKVQQHMTRLARATGSIHHQDIQAAAKTGQWGANQTDGAGEEFRATQAKLMLHTVRIRDEKVRMLVEKFRSGCTAVIMANERKASDTALGKVMEAQSVLNEYIGQVLRRLDEGDDRLS